MNSLHYHDLIRIEEFASLVKTDNGYDQDEQTNKFWNPIDGTEKGDDHITNNLLKKNQLKYIFELNQEWVEKVSNKLLKWMKMLETVVRSTKADKLRDIDSRQTLKQ